MNEGKHDIDRLLQANVEGQLAHIDWNRFGNDISKHLAAVELRHRPRRRYLGPLAAAAALVLAAGVLVVVLVGQRESAIPTSTVPGRATVSLEDPGGIATVILGRDSVARCNVTLIDSNGSSPAAAAPSSWCLVVRHEASSDGPDRRRDRESIAYLF